MDANDARTDIVRLDAPQVSGVPSQGVEERPIPGHMVKYGSLASSEFAQGSSGCMHLLSFFIVPRQHPTLSREM